MNDEPDTTRHESTTDDLPTTIDGCERELERLRTKRTRLELRRAAADADLMRLTIAERGLEWATRDPQVRGRGVDR